MSGDLADARRRAEEARSEYLSAVTVDEIADELAPRTLDAMIGLRRSLEALLAALPGEATLPDGRYECHCCGAPIIPGAVVFCAECYHASGTIWRACPHYTAGDAHAGCQTCGGFGAIPEAPSPDPVREAAESLRRLALQDALGSPDALDALNDLFFALDGRKP